MGWKYPATHTHTLAGGEEHMWVDHCLTQWPVSSDIRNAGPLYRPICGVEVLREYKILDLSLLRFFVFWWTISLSFSVLVGSRRAAKKPFLASCRGKSLNPKTFLPSRRCWQIDLSIERWHLLRIFVSFSAKLVHLRQFFSRSSGLSASIQLLLVLSFSSAVNHPLSLSLSFKKFV